MSGATQPTPMRQNWTSTIPWEDNRNQFLRVITTDDDDWQKVENFLGSPDVDAKSFADIGLMNSLCKKPELDKETHKAIKAATWSQSLQKQFEALAFYLSRGCDITDEVNMEFVQMTNCLTPEALLQTPASTKKEEDATATTASYRERGAPFE